jgi:hypothetical protein
MNVGRDDSRMDSTNLIHFFVTFVTFISRSNHFDGHLWVMSAEALHKPNSKKNSKTNLAFYCVFDPGALPNISETAVCEIVVTISSDLSGEVSQSGEGVGERDAR